MTKRDHVTEDGSTFVATDRSDEEQIGCQAVPFRHEAADAVELGPVVPHQGGVVWAGQEFTRLLLLAPAELVRHQLSFLSHQRIATVPGGGVGLGLRSQRLDLLLDGGELRGSLQLVLFLGWQGLPEFRVAMQSHPAKAIVHDTANFSVKVSPLKVGPGVVRHIGIAKGPLVFVSAMLHALSRRIELVCTAGSLTGFQVNRERTHQ